MNIKIKLSHPSYKEKDLRKSVEEILESNKLLSMATTKNKTESYINTAFFSYNDQLDFFILTDPKSQHSQNLNKNNSIALSIFDSRQSWAGDLKGLQLMGTAKQASSTEGAEGLTLYMKRFAALKDFVEHPEDIIRGKSVLNSRIYIIKTHWLKIFDSKRFGDDVFIPIDY